MCNIYVHISINLLLQNQLFYIIYFPNNELLGDGHTDSVGGFGGGILSSFPIILRLRMLNFYVW